MVFYSPKFIKEPANAKKFMIALVKAIRFYDDALKGGHLAGPNADAVINAWSNTPSSRTRQCTAPSFRRRSIRTANSTCRRCKWLGDISRTPVKIDGKVKVEDVIDLTYVHEAAKALGPYVRKTAP